MGQGQGPTAEDLIQYLDLDGDGQVSGREFDGLDMFDRNNDGYISSAEASKHPPRRQ